jgi:hypothetical protein
MRSPLASPGSGPHVSGSGAVPGPRGSRRLGMAPELERDQLGSYERAVCTPPSRREKPDIPLPIHITLRPAGPVRCRLNLWQPAPVSR